MNQSDQLLLEIFGSDPVVSATPPTAPPVIPPICPFPPPAQAKAWDIIKLAHRVNYKFHSGFDEIAFCKRFNMHTYGETRQQVA